MGGLLILLRFGERALLTLAVVFVANASLEPHTSSSHLIASCGQHRKHAARGLYVGPQLGMEPKFDACCALSRIPSDSVHVMRVHIP